METLPISNNTMSNMSYCRFENTLSDLQDCEGALFDTLGETENRKRASLIKLCHDIAKQVPLDEIADLPTDDDDEDDEEDND